MRKKVNKKVIYSLEVLSCLEEMEKAHQVVAAPDLAGAWVDEGKGKGKGKGEWAEHGPAQDPAGTVSAPVAGRVPHIKWELPATT
ncbi:MAG: hypothetical protein WBC11_06360 [Dehalococcoidia bacterium]